MNIVFVTTWDDKGEQFNGKRVHDYLNGHGDESHMLVRYKSFKDEKIHLVCNPLTRFFDQTIAAGFEKSVRALGGLTTFWNNKCVLPKGRYYSSRSNSRRIIFQSSGNPNSM